MASGSMSEPQMRISRLLASSYFSLASVRILRSSSWGTQGQLSMAKERVRPGARPRAMNAASTSSVPVPQQGSYSRCQGCQPDCRISAAASVSRMGA